MLFDICAMTGLLLVGLRWAAGPLKASAEIANVVNIAQIKYQINAF
jgi:hypothetical protein